MSTQVREFDATEFRRQLAGLVESRPAEAAPEEFREYGAILCVVLARLFGESLDRKTLWHRISSAIESAVQKAPDGGHLLICDALEHCKASGGEAASDEQLARLFNEVEAMGEDWNRQWARYLKRCLPAVVVHGRNTWERYKAATKKSAGEKKPEPAEASNGQTMFDGGDQ